MSGREALSREVWTPDHGERDDRLRLLRALCRGPAVGPGRVTPRLKPGAFHLRRASEPDGHASARQSVDDPICQHKTCRQPRSQHDRYGLRCPDRTYYQRFKGPSEPGEAG